ncbi:MAG: toll/interleukin-1 receptor domain-containing protein [Alphaproteobacteria bacterium]|nr:toll/interleukin-1 receptor domain-containing protein [Alphaproteobacteria bacterium]
MADEEHVALLMKGVRAWNSWRDEGPVRWPDLSGADFSNAKLAGANLIGADLKRSNLVGADLSHSSLSGASLSGAKLNGVDLRNSNISRSSLSNASLSHVDFSRANLSRANLSGAEFNGSAFADTVFGALDLTEARGLETCHHFGPSIVDYRTLELSKHVPLKFWCGCGLPDRLIDYLPSLTGDAILYYSCFISHSTKDLEFAERLHADLQDKGVRCWFSAHDMEIGGDIWDDIDSAIRTRDKIVLILSENALDSGWVEDEVKKGFAEERSRDERVLFPVRIDDAVMGSNEPWATKLRDNRLIGDFTAWKDYDAYKRTFERVLRDLKKAG